MPAENRTVDFLFAGTMEASYPRAWLREAMGTASSAFILFDGRSLKPEELRRYHDAARHARFIVSPPGDVPETSRPYHALAMGTPPLLIEDRANRLRPWLACLADSCSGTLRLAGSCWASMSVKVTIDEVYPRRGFFQSALFRSPRRFSTLAGGSR